MRPASQLIEQGIKSYTRGQLGEAERFWREALALEPLNDRARAYLDLLQGGPGATGATSRATPPPAPGALSPPPSRATPPPSPFATPPPVSHATPVPSPFAAALPTSYPTPPPASLAYAISPPIATPPPEAPSYPAAAAPLAPHPAEGAVPLPAPGEQAAEGAPEAGGRTTLSDYAPSPWDQGPAEQNAIVLEGEGGLDLATIDEKSDLRPLVPDQGHPTPPPPVLRKPISDVEVWMQGARELHALGDFSGSLEMIEKILKLDPAHAEARAYLAQNEATLIAMYESKLGTMATIPRLAIKPEEVLWLNLDHRAGFLLAQIDGLVNYEDLFALSGLPRLDTARILATLLQEGVIVS